MSEPCNSQYMTVEEYLKFEGRSSQRHEYVRGQVFAMSGSTDSHNVISVNLVGALFNHLQGSACRVYNNDMRLRLEAANCFYYPDIMVTCEPVRAKSVFKHTPRLIVEVLSPSTRSVDRREKLVAYKELESLRQYVIVHQDRMRVEVHTRVANSRWDSITLGRSDELVMEALPDRPLRISVSKIYQGLDLPSVVEESEEEYELA